MLKILIITFFLFFYSTMAFSHSGPHGNDECIVNVGHINLRLNGYQFQGKHPDRHYCRHYPQLGETIIKIDSTSNDLSLMAIELQLLKRNSWLGLLTDQPLTIIKKLPIQYFSKGVVSISYNIPTIDIYAIKLQLHKSTGQVIEQQFLFIAGIPFAQFMVGIAILLFLTITIVFIKQLNTH